MTATKWFFSMAIAALLGGILVAVGFAAFQATQAGRAQTAAEAGAEASAPEDGGTDTVTLAFGEVFDAYPLSLTVISAGPATLPEAKPAPPAGMTRVVVVASARNVSDQDVAINAVPYSVYNTSLTVNGQEYNGGMYTGAVALRDGTVDAQSSVSLRFLFEVPEDSRTATFSWPPASWYESHPTLRVPISDVSTTTP